MKIRTDAEIYAEIDKEDKPISRRVIRGRNMKIEWEDLLDMYDFDDCVLCPVEEPEKIIKEVER